jgi:hypothetical protein
LRLYWWNILLVLLRLYPLLCHYLWAQLRLYWWNILLVLLRLYHL